MTVSITREGTIAVVTVDNPPVNALSQALRQALWSAYGPQVQQAWREQLVPDGQPPQFDPDEPF